MTVGLCTVVDLNDFSVQTYVLSTYALAADQALELTKGVSGVCETNAEHVDPVSGLRTFMLSFPAHNEVIIVAEVEVGDSVLEVKL